jgi:hypothetical protein
LYQSAVDASQLFQLMSCADTAADMRPSTTRLLALAAWSVLVAGASGGCGSSLAIGTSPGIDEIGDPLARYFSAPVVEDVVDGRWFPTTCTVNDDCIDGDPCTRDACSDDGTCIFFPVTTPPEYIMYLGSAGPAKNVVLSNNWLFIAEGATGVEVIDVTNPEIPQPVAFIATAAAAEFVAANDALVAVAEGTAGAEFFSRPGLQRLGGLTPRLAPIERLRHEVVGFSLGPRYSIAAGYADGLEVLDLASPAAPGAIGYLPSSGRVVSAGTPSADWSLVADSLGGALVIDFNADGGPAVATTLLTNGRVVAVAVRTDTALVAEWGVGFSVVDMSTPLKAARMALVPSDFPVVAAGLIGPRTGAVALQNGVVARFVFLVNKPVRFMAGWQADREIVDMAIDRGLIVVALEGGVLALLRTGCTTR